MKRISRISLTALLVFFIPVAAMIAQDNKSTRQVKVIVEDKDGSKVIVDSTFSSTLSIDTIKTKDGSVIFIGAHNGVSDADSKGSDLMAWTISEKGSKGRVIYINDGSPVKISEGGKRFNVEVITDNDGRQTAKSNYVIAKDGMVITIEGGDEAKVKEMGELIESRIGKSKDDKDATLSVVKEESKKTVKKQR